MSPVPDAPADLVAFPLREPDGGIAGPAFPRLLATLELWRPAFTDNRLLLIRDGTDTQRARAPRTIPRRHPRALSRILHVIADQLGMSLLGFGSCRAVFDLSSDCVLKVGFSQLGLCANQLEADIASRLPDALHARVYRAAPDGLWLVQERVEVAAVDMRCRDARQLRRALAAFLGCRPHLLDLHRGNVGRRADGTLVAVDLESFPRHGRRSPPAFPRYLAPG